MVNVFFFRRDKKTTFSDFQILVLYKCKNTSFLTKSKSFCYTSFVQELSRVLDIHEKRYLSKYLGVKNGNRDVFR